MHTNYATIPEILIPKNFEYTELEVSQNNDSSIISTKKLSLVETIGLICTLITTFCTLATFLQNQYDVISSKISTMETSVYQEESISLKKEENKLLEKQISAIEKNTEYLATFLRELQEKNMEDKTNDCPHQKLNPYKADD